MKQIEISKGKVVLVNDEDYEWLSRWKWNATYLGSHWYATRNAYSRTGKNKRSLLYMHRVIMNAPKGMEVDHINGDGLDNQRCNLRLATHSENLMNRGRTKANTSKYKGVVWYKPTKKWKAQIRANNKGKNLGYFDTPEEAARVYNEAAKQLHGTFARLNKLEGNG